MPTHTEQQFSPYDTRQIFGLVADIERYPEFLPWCRAARVLERKDNEFLGELVISFAHLSERYTSRVLLDPPADGQSPGSIDVTMVRGPFHHLVNRWRFTPHPEGGSQIDFFLDFRFKSRILESMIGPLFSKAAAKMVTAFKARADALYGKGAR
jgi:coenzyme Q-binding protein COQ10